MSSFSNFQETTLGKGSNNQNGNLRCFFFMKGGGSRVPHNYSENDFLENPLESFPDCENVYLVWTLYYVYIVVEVT